MSKQIEALKAIASAHTSADMYTREYIITNFINPARAALADELEIFAGAFEAAAELRRLHEVNTELMEVLKTMPHPEHHTGVTHLTHDWYEWDNRRRAVIAKATGEQS